MVWPFETTLTGSHITYKSEKNMNTLNVGDEVLVRNCNGGVEVCKIVILLYTQTSIKKLIKGGNKDL